MISCERPFLRNAFSLTELLVVVAIVAILTMLVLPGARIVKDSALTAMCLSNLKQISAASQLYSSDNDGCLIPMCSGTAGAYHTWRNLMIPYLQTMQKIDSIRKPFVCPADTIGLKSPGLGSTGFVPASYGLHESEYYAVNRLHNYITYVTNRRLMAVRAPSFTIQFCDLGRTDNPNNDALQWTEKGRGVGSASYGYALLPGDNGYNGGDAWNAFPRHGRRTKLNAVFYDGHAESVDWKSEIIANPRGTPGCRYDNH